MTFFALFPWQTTRAHSRFYCPVLTSRVSEIDCEMAFADMNQAAPISVEYPPNKKAAYRPAVSGCILLMNSEKPARIGISPNIPGKAIQIAPCNQSFCLMLKLTMELNQRAIQGYSETQRFVEQESQKWIDSLFNLTNDKTTALLLFHLFQGAILDFLATGNAQRGQQSIKAFTETLR